MKINLQIWLIFFSFFGILKLSYSQIQTHNPTSGDTTQYFLQTDEELIYIVKYAFLNLGEVKFQVNNKSVIDGKKVTETIAFMDSYEGLPLVDLHHKYYSFIDSNFCPVMFLGLNFDEDTNFVKYSFKGDSLIKITKGNFNTGKIKFDSTASVNQTFQDGLSILFYARRFVGSDTTLFVPCFVNEKQEKTKINFFNENESVEIESVNYEIDCLRIDGETDFVSVYGLTGEFEGWFSNDNHTVPIKAKMNVIIGSITLELLKWNKKNWNPPNYIN